MKHDLVKEIFTDKMSLIYAYLLKIGCNKPDAEDIIQDTFYKALTYLDVIESSKISAWLFKVSINKYYDLCRKNKRHIHINIDDKILKEALSDGTLCEDYLLNLERKQDILLTLNSLNDIYKNLLILKYVMNLSYNEIAEILDINQNTVKTYLFRAREQFKKYWRDIKDE